MPKPGDRIIIEGTKLGQVRREGQLVRTVGSLMQIRWTDGSESLLTPGAGTVQVLPGRAAKKKPAKNTGRTTGAKAASTSKAKKGRSGKKGRAKKK